MTDHVLVLNEAAEVTIRCSAANNCHCDRSLVVLKQSDSQGQMQSISMCADTVQLNSAYYIAEER